MNKFESLLEKFEREGKVTTLPPKQVSKLHKGLMKDLAEYRAEDKIRRYKSEQDILVTILNA